MYIKNFNETPEQKILIQKTPEEFDQYMVAKYPKLFKDRFKPMTETCMCWGFEIGNGWFPLMDELCQKIQTLCDKFNFNVVFDQIKEKCGGGSFYIFSG